MRLVLEQHCDEPSHSPWRHRKFNGCNGGKATIIDPDHLPAHAIEAAHSIMQSIVDNLLDRSGHHILLSDEAAEMAIGAFLNALGEKP